MFTLYIQYCLEYSLVQLYGSLCVCVCVGVNTSKYIYESYIPSFTFWCISLRLQVSGNEEISYNFGDIKTLVNIQFWRRHTLKELGPQLESKLEIQIAPKVSGEGSWVPGSYKWAFGSYSLTMVSSWKSLTWSELRCQVIVSKQPHSMGTASCTFIASEASGFKRLRDWLLGT